MGRYIIEFEKGGAFELEFDSRAPKTVAAFREFVSNREKLYEVLVLQGRFSGEEMYFSAPMGSVCEENNVAPIQGSVAFNPDPRWSAICIYWGGQLAEKDHYHNLFAHIKGDLEELYAVGTRIWQKGGENVTLKETE